MSERINPIDHPEQLLERKGIRHTPPNARHHVVVYDKLNGKLKTVHSAQDVHLHHTPVRLHNDNDVVGTFRGETYLHTDGESDTNYSGFPCVVKKGRDQRW